MLDTGYGLKAPEAWSPFLRLSWSGFGQHLDGRLPGNKLHINLSSIMEEKWDRYKCYNYRKATLECPPVSNCVDPAMCGPVVLNLCTPWCLLLLHSKMQLFSCKWSDKFKKHNYPNANYSSDICLACCYCF